MQMQIILEMLYRGGFEDKREIEAFKSLVQKEINVPEEYQQDSKWKFMLNEYMEYANNAKTNKELDAIRQLDEKIENLPRATVQKFLCQLPSLFSHSKSGLYARRKFYWDGKVVSKKILMQKINEEAGA